ncbi:hypothetical protein MAPG_04935 [Magnaporthiopsis poae ATCC 64411]|uniref:Uncharacterized protein n=1 Tax=Magnaporthiopsis poae (strain ATCC 64411 / 73-15) TaxID=644358 RepID=A0A0C4DY26_MAGP6|nr:hypothetical protein MAPG_04935 [Magnaporthiopsis poae ATCC 64411]
MVRRGPLGGLFRLHSAPFCLFPRAHSHQPTTGRRDGLNRGRPSCRSRVGLAETQWLDRQTDYAARYGKRPADASSAVGRGPRKRSHVSVQYRPRLSAKHEFQNIDAASPTAAKVVFLLLLDTPPTMDT